MSKLLQYAPLKRYNAIHALTHPFFDELRDPATRLPNGKALPPLFNWLPGELDEVAPDVKKALVQRPQAAGASSSS